MAIKTIAVVLSDMATDGAALATARAIAERESAHLDVHCVGIDPVRYDPMPIGATAIIIEASNTDARERADAIEKWALAQLAGMTALATQSVVLPQMAMDTMVARLARYADLVVAAKPYGQGRTPMHVNVLESELFGTGAPVLVVPGDKPVTETFKRVAVAWNESSESFAAVRAALPLLKATKQVDIVMIDPPSHSPERSDPGGAICMMLSRHGIRCEVSILARTLPRVSDILLRFAAEHRCDAIVMGAYGHSRFRESILGGATRDMLEKADLPLVMAH